MKQHKIDFGFISTLEGGSITEGYVPDPDNSKSGVTIATGFDLGCRNQTDLVDLGLPENIVAAFTPYLGLQGRTALDKLKSTPLALHQVECQYIDFCVKKSTTNGVITEYNNNSQTEFTSLPAEWQTVIASVSFQYGSLKTRCPTFFGYVVNRQWDKAIAELRNFGDRYSSRRNKEADLVSAQT